VIALDTSSLIAFFHGANGIDVEGVDAAFELKCAVLSPVVVSELLSDHKLSTEVIKLIQRIPTLTILPGFWERAGLMRSRILRRGLKARLADTLIAQTCIDHQVELITRDSDYKHFAKYEKLELWDKKL
jgi:predicted nucleic acid-binding protein